MTEGTAAAWERVRYQWDIEEGRVDISTLDSKLFGAGGGWVFTATPETDGTRVDVVLTRQPSSAKGKVLAQLLKLVAPSSLRKSYAGPLKAKK